MNKIKLKNFKIFLISIVLIISGCNLSSSVNDPILYLIPGAQEEIERQDKEAFLELNMNESMNSNKTIESNKPRNYSVESFKEF